jgi:uncharacterized protein YqjF (DUF2071 family)
MRDQARSTRLVAHRPWPLPRGPWVMGQTWESLLFAHWPVEPELMRRVLPGRLGLDTFAGTAWLGVVPFEVRALRLRGLPPLPFGSRFLELNVRTYCTYGDRPGVYFFSLDAASPLAVAAARATYRLPYFHARMSLERDGTRLTYESRRARGPAAEWHAEYQPAGERFTAAPGTLEHFLIERYCLYAVAGDRVLRAEIHHRPWPLRRAAGRILRNSMTRPVGIELASAEPLLHFAGRQDVVVWPPRRA